MSRAVDFANGCGPARRNNQFGQGYIFHRGIVAKRSRKG
jgi:hypothetical protein